MWKKLQITLVRFGIAMLRDMVEDMKAEIEPYPEKYIETKYRDNGKLVVRKIPR